MRDPRDPQAQRGLVRPAVAVSVGPWARHNMDGSTEARNACATGPPTTDCQSCVVFEIHVVFGIHLASHTLAAHAA